MHIICQEHILGLASYNCIFHNNFYSQDDIVTMAILMLQICNRTRDTMVLSLVSCSLTETIEILINTHAVINTHPVFVPKNGRFLTVCGKKVAPNK